MQRREPPESCDVAVVGAGILGLAVARELLRRRPGTRLVVLEREPAIARHQTSHNSGVLHAGVYYAPGSLKARLCVRGAALLYEFCEQHGVRVERCGKLIVATRAEELGPLAEIERRGRENGVPGLRRLDAAGIAEVEPHARGLVALHSPATGIVDFPAVADALAAEVEAAGGEIVVGCGVRALEQRGRELVVRHDLGETHAGRSIACAGAWSDRLAVASGADADLRIVPFRGAYLKLRPERRELVRGLVYPVPDVRLPFLGIHLTRHIDGDVLVGPSALLVGARDGYRLTRLSPRDALETLTWPGTYRVLRRWWRTGATEVHTAVSRSAFVAAAARFVPELTVADVVAGPAGVRAQAVDRAGNLVDDFAFSQTGSALHVRNAPSPAATSSLAIAEHVVDAADEALGSP